MYSLRERPTPRKVFLLSGIDDKKRKELARTIHLLGGSYIDLQDFKAVCTHVVCGKLSRSEKFLGACATGKWVLHPDYVHDSNTAGCWLDEEQYEWCDDHISQRYEVDFSLALASRRWRFLLGDVNAAFTGWKVAVIAGVKRSKVIKRLLISGGAEVFNMKIPVRNPGKVADTIGYIFVSENNTTCVAHLVDYGVLCIKPEFIGDFLISDPQPDPMDYLIQMDSNPELQKNVDHTSQDSFLMESQRSMYLSPGKQGSSNRSDFPPLSSISSTPASATAPSSSATAPSSSVTAPSDLLDIMESLHDCSNAPKPSDTFPSHVLHSQSSKATISSLLHDATEEVLSYQEPGPSNSGNTRGSELKNGGDIKVALDESIIDLTQSADESPGDNERLRAQDNKNSEELERVEGKGKTRKSERNLVKKSPVWKSLIPRKKLLTSEEIKKETSTCNGSSDNDMRFPHVDGEKFTMKPNLIEQMKENIKIPAQVHHNSTSDVQGLTSDVQHSSKPSRPTGDMQDCSIATSSTIQSKAMRSTAEVQSSSKATSSTTPMQHTSTPSRSSLTKRHLLQARMNLSPITKFFQRIEKPDEKVQSDRMNKSDLSNKPVSAISLVTKPCHLNRSDRSSKPDSVMEPVGDNGEIVRDLCDEEESDVTEKQGKQLSTCAESWKENRVDKSIEDQKENIVFQSTGNRRETKLNQSIDCQKENIINQSIDKLRENELNQSVDLQNTDCKGVRKRKSTDTEPDGVTLHGPSDRKRPMRTSPCMKPVVVINRIEVESTISAEIPIGHNSITPSSGKNTSEKFSGNSQIVQDQIASTTDLQFTRENEVKWCDDSEENTESRGSERKRQPDRNAELQHILTDIKRRKVNSCEWCPSMFAVNLREYQDVPESVRMASTTTDIFSATLEDGFTLEALQYLACQVSFKFYLQPRTISELLRNVLLTTEEDIESNMAYNILSRLLLLHPPITASLQDVYLRALAGVDIEHDWQVGAEWSFIQQCLSDILTAESGVFIRNNVLIFKFILQLLQQNLQHYMENSNLQTDSGTRHLLLRIIWCPSYHVVFNTRCRTLVKIMFDVVLSYRANDCVSEKKDLLDVLDGVLWMIAMVAESCRIQECRNLETVKALQAENKTSVFVYEIARKLIDLDIKDTDLLQNLFHGLQLSWLRVGVCQQMLNTQDDYLLAEDNVQDAKSITLLLIVTRYIYLLPLFDVVPRHLRPQSPIIVRTKQISKTSFVRSVSNCLTENTELNKNNIDNMKATKKNPKGETPLHVACIRNDVTAVKRLLRFPGLDINAADNFGWTPLHEACNHGNIECVRELLKFVPAKTMDVFFNNGGTSCRKVDLLATSQEGITPLHDAVLNDRLDVCQVLLKHGGPNLLSVQTCQSYTPQDLAQTADMDTLLASFRNVRRRHNDSQGSPFGSQESTSSSEDNVPSSPSDDLYQEVLYVEDERVYANTKSLTRYIQLVTLLLRHYISARNLPQIVQAVNSKLHPYQPNSRDCEVRNNRNHQEKYLSQMTLTTDTVCKTPSCLSTPKCSCFSKGCLGSSLPTIERRRSMLRHDSKTEVNKDDMHVSEISVKREEVLEMKRELKLLNNLSHYIHLYRSHLLKISRPEDSALVERQLQLLTFVTDCL